MIDQGFYKPTLELRWNVPDFPYDFSGLSTIFKKRLQQKWMNVDTGSVEWRDVPEVKLPPEKLEILKDERSRSDSYPPA